MFCLTVVLFCILLNTHCPPGSLAVPEIVAIYSLDSVSRKGAISHVVQTSHSPYLVAVSNGCFQNYFDCGRSKLPLNMAVCEFRTTCEIAPFLLTPPDLRCGVGAGTPR
jgi:hypothetical protein